MNRPTASLDINGHTDRANGRNECKLILEQKLEQQRHSFIKNNNHIVPYKNNSNIVSYKYNKDIVPYKNNSNIVSYKYNKDIVPNKNDNDKVPYFSNNNKVPYWCSFFGVNFFGTTHFFVVGGDGGDGGDEGPTCEGNGGDGDVQGGGGTELDASFGNHPLVLFSLGFLFLQTTKS
jgi:hypothetical protein